MDEEHHASIIDILFLLWASLLVMLLIISQKIIMVDETLLHEFLIPFAKVWLWLTIISTILAIGYGIYLLIRGR